ncbi:MAG TPA: hypothetical protein VGS97_20050 [Actinocrinis sp.]|uniref:hypothetical protein n=1 Tax=Actinocrinis sp. TaxID=1920516 RepID=UPI002DDCFBC2|nr:hypothetical protein [Actinocrinis sp.]HEV2346402.1 hypothetical protein [Actinocrinis sp.]
MSTAREQLLEMVRKVVDQYFGDSDDYEDNVKPMADDLLAALTANEVTEGWLITGKRILKVEETSLTDPGDENWAYDVYCTPPEDDEDDEETED